MNRPTRAAFTRSALVQAQAGRPTEFALIVGAMKSGTTSLFEILAQHHEIAAARSKELRFFSDSDLWGKGWEWYQGLFDWKADVHRIALEASPEYTAFPTKPDVPARIASVGGAGFRFIYIMRNPLTQIQSNVRHVLYAGWGQSLDEGIPEWMMDIVHYSMQIEQYLAFFPRERLLLVTLEEFEQQPDVVLRRVCNFLEVDDTFSFQQLAERFNSGDAYSMARIWARLVRFKPLQAVAYRLLPRTYRHRIRSLVSKLPGRRRALGRHELTSDECAAILRRLAPDLQRLERIHGVDVARYWFSRLPN
jgi:hypothetical protein